MPRPEPCRTGTLGLMLGCAVLLGLSACGRDGPEVPRPGEGAAGLVETDNAGAAQNPITPALPGGPAGQGASDLTPAGAPTAQASSTGPAHADR